MKNWIVTKDKIWFEKWNKLLLKDDKSVFLQNIYRVKSYQKYGMDYELLLCLDNDNNIICGSANVIIKFFFFKLYICSYGPTINLNYIDQINISNFFKKFNSRGKELRAFTSQISLLNNTPSFIEFKSYDGRVFEQIPIPKYKNRVSLKRDSVFLTKEKLISSFLPKGRRDVKSSYRKGLISKIPKSEKDLKIAYSCIESNANNKGYNVRKWDDIKDFIIDSVNNEMTFIITAWFGETLQGTIVLERSCNMLSYTMGGVKRNKPDLLTGYFLQSEAMLLAINEGIDYYDISFGGPPEVQRFKSLFNPILNEHYKTIYFVNSKIKHLIFSFAYKYLKGFIKTIVLLLKK